MIQFRQRNLIWLGILSAMTAVAVIGADIPAVEVILLALTAGAVVGSFVNFRTARPEALVEAIQQRAPGSPNARITPQAREAVARAAGRGAAPPPGVMLQDLGLIAMHTGEDGMVMRRTRALSKDDDSTRPFITLYVAPSEADRQSIIRFEIIDQNGQDQYVHEMRVYLRDGEVNILADHHLPLYGNTRIEGFGTWDLRVYLDGQMLAMHSVAMQPSDEDRQNRLGRRVDARRYITQSEDDEAGSGGARAPRRRLAVEGDEGDLPMTLEQLLRTQKDQNRTSSER
jgi:hypothetical protein